jgi:hypothetical protein
MVRTFDILEYTYPASSLLHTRRACSLLVKTYDYSGLSVSYCSQTSTLSDGRSHRCGVDGNSPRFRRRVRLRSGVNLSGVKRALGLQANVHFERSECVNHFRFCQKIEKEAVGEVVNMLQNPVQNGHSASACWQCFYSEPWTLCFRCCLDVPQFPSHDVYAGVRLVHVRDFSHSAGVARKMDIVG